MIDINHFFKQHEEDIMFVVFTMSIGFLCSILIYIIANFSEQDWKILNDLQKKEVDLSPHTPASRWHFGGESSLPAERHSECRSAGTPTECPPEVPPEADVWGPNPTSENIENIVDILEHLHSDITFLKNNEKVLIRKLNYITTKHHLLEKMMKTFNNKTIVTPVENKKKYIVLRSSARLMNMKKINYKE
jgi:hypothetical protein